MATFNYSRCYDQLMAKARSRVLEGYVEKHHVIPRCIGGTKARKNLVQLTAEEHYVAHQLLAKIYPSEFGLAWAAMAMTNATAKMGRNNKCYGWLRRKFAAGLSERMKGRKLSAEVRAKISTTRLGKKIGPYATHPSRNKGIPKSEEHRAKLSAAKLGTSNASGKRCGTALKNIRAAVIVRNQDFLKALSYKSGQSVNMKEIWARRKAGELPMPKSMLQQGG